MKVYAKVDFQAGERACVKNARPNHIGGQSPPFFACFDRICSLFRGFHREENHAQVCVKNRMNTNSGACNAKKPVFAGFLQASEAKKEAFMENRQTRFSLHISEETLDTAKALSKSDGSKSVSEYIEKAVDFYNAYLCNRRAPELISSETVDTLRRVLDKCEHARSSALFKLSVEISMLLNVIAATNDIEDEDLGKLRHACIEEVRRINGSVSLDNAIEWQK